MLSVGWCQNMISLIKRRGQESVDVSYSSKLYSKKIACGGKIQLLFYTCQIVQKPTLWVSDPLYPKSLKPMAPILRKSRWPSISLALPRPSANVSGGRGQFSNPDRFP